ADAAQARSAPFLLVAGLAALACLVPDVRVAIARRVPIDPNSPVHLLALVLALVLFGAQLQGAFGNALSQAAGGAQALDRVDLVAGELPFLVLAIAGVGYLVRRSARESMQRLGLVRPAWWHVVVAVAAAGAFYALGIGFGALGAHFTPGTSQEVNSATNRIFGQLLVDPVGIATIAIAAGVCEEILFRGALQPRFGILATSLLFAAVHTQYGLSFDALAVLVLAFGLGLIRKYLNTTTSVICHTLYDALVGISLVGVALLAGLVLEAGLIAGLVVGFAFARRPAKVASPVP
ncbi:MAG TPA: type II CAAX endopeptidase family protein, partial [Solirubrobacterales bacterium]|nr:type II CAAX endopeptidase family protein [Solirubrobacterales bacterium]